MRPYQPKDNVQKKAYYSDRFRTPSKTKRSDPAKSDVFKGEDGVIKEFVEVIESYVEIGQLVVYVRPVDIKKTLRFLKEEQKYEILTEMSAIDFLAERGGFELFYQMLNLEDAKRLRVKCFLPKGDTVSTVSDLFSSANWAEREMYDMFGIQVNNHPYFKRILMPDDWEGHPLLKTYPLIGDEAASWYEVDKIFGKERREEIGPENRDTAMVKETDTENFSRIYHEVPFGAPPSEGKVEKRYQESARPPLIRKLDPRDSTVLKKRK